MLDVYSKNFTIDFTSVAMTKIFNNTERDSVLKTEREETRNKETGGGGGGQYDSVAFSQRSTAPPSDSEQYYR